MEKIQISFPPELLKEMDDYIEAQKGRTGLDRAQYIRQLVLNDLNQHKLPL
jgi:metal-responsive CopG/Arc/MetJ family transcriptional regulator